MRLANHDSALYWHLVLMSSDAQYILPFLRLMKLQLTCVHYYIYVTSQFAALQLNSGRLLEICYPSFTTQNLTFLQKLKPDFFKTLRKYYELDAAHKLFNLEAQFKLDW